MCTLTDWLPLVSAVLTLLAILVALFKDKFWAWAQRPRLSVRIKMQPPDCLSIPLMGQDPVTNQVLSIDAYYFRLWVENSGGQANNVQVFANRLERDSGEGVYEEVPAFLPMSLKWSNMPDPPPPIYASALHHKMGRHCDLGNIINFLNALIAPNVLSASPSGDRCLKLATEADPNAGSNRLPAGSYRLQLKIAGENAIPITKVIRIDFDGSWRDDMSEMFTSAIRLVVL